MQSPAKNRSNRSLSGERKRGKIIVIWVATSFFSLQILTDLCHSLTAFPFVHYGMFSETFPRPDSLPVFEITVNGRRLRAQDFLGASHDLLYGPLLDYERQAETRDFAIDKQKISKGLGWAGVDYRSIEHRLSNDTGLAGKFPGWYREYLSRLLKEDIRDLKVIKSWYRYDDGHFIQTSQENQFSFVQ